MKDGISPGPPISIIRQQHLFPQNSQKYAMKSKRNEFSRPVFWARVDGRLTG